MTPLEGEGASASIGKADTPPVLEGFVFVPPGTFTMGSPDDELGRNPGELQHEVTLRKGFFLGATEVTQAEWRRLMRTNPSAHSDCDECPVETVNWWEAAAYANALSLEQGLDECYELRWCNRRTAGLGMECQVVNVTASEGNPYECEGYRLPTEAEWEYAYRAGAPTAFYNGGEITDEYCEDPTLNDIGWYCGNSGDRTHPVRQNTHNAWELYDMAGNVSEWTWDGWDFFSSDPVTDPAPGGKNRVMRGGSFFTYAAFSRAAARYHGGGPGARDADLGFRVARTGGALGCGGGGAGPRDRDAGGDSGEDSGGGAVDAGGTDSGARDGGALGDACHFPRG